MFSEKVVLTSLHFLHSFLRLRIYSHTRNYCQPRDQNDEFRSERKACKVRDKDN